MTSKTKSIQTSENWALIETKSAGPERATSTMKVRIPGAGKGKKGGKKKDLVLHIPRSLIPEVKRMFSAAFWDAETIDAPSVGPSVYGFFATVVQGNGAPNRQGDQIFVEKIVIRLEVVGSVSAPAHVASLALILDKEPAVVAAVAAVPGWTDIFQGIGGASAQAYNVAIPNYDKRARFGYLERISEPIVPTSSATGGSVYVASKMITIEQKINRKIRYDATSGTPYAGAELFLYGWSDLTSNVPKVNGSYELFFTDA